MKKKYRFNGWYNMTCAICGKEFYAQRSSGMYCSNACKQEGYRRAKKAMDEAKKDQLPMYENQGG